MTSTRNKRFYPIDPDFFQQQIMTLISNHKKCTGRPPKIDPYESFCAILYVLRTGLAWRDLPPSYGNWHTIYTRFNRWSQSGLFQRILQHLQQQNSSDIAWIDSTTILVHRHGSGSLKKKENNPLPEDAKG